MSKELNDVNITNDTEETVETPTEGNDDTVVEEPQDDKDLKLKTALAQKNHYKKKYEDAIKNAGKVAPVATQKQDSSEVDTLRLEVRGFSDSEEQKVILRAAKSLGVSVVEAANDEFVKARIETMRRDKKVAAAIPDPSNKADSQAKDLDYFIEKDELPSDPEMIVKVTNELRRRQTNKR